MPEQHEDEVPDAARRPRADPDYMTSLERGISVLRAFAGAGRAQTIAELGHRTGLSRAVVRRCLHTLQVLGYAAQDGRHYRLTPKVLALGHAYLSSAPLSATAQPFLDRVSATVQESCSLAVLDGDEIVYVARAAANRILSVALGVGSRLPAYCTSMGRVLLAELPPEDLARHLDHLRMERLTDRTVADPATLRRILEEVRARGWAVVDQELERGLRAIAVPVRDLRGRVVAAMNVGAQATRGTVRDLERTCLPVLQEAARDLAPLLLDV